MARHPEADEIVIGGEDRIPYMYKMDRPHNMKVGEDAALVRKLVAQDGAIFALDWSPDARAWQSPAPLRASISTTPRAGSPVVSCKGHAAASMPWLFRPIARTWRPEDSMVRSGSMERRTARWKRASCPYRSPEVGNEMGQGNHGGR